jgi:hypothetical protein
MKILTAFLTGSCNLPKFRVPSFRQFKLGQNISNAAQAYARAMSIPYLVIFAMDRDGLWNKEHTNRDD